jgi:hypothetical protein
MEALTEEQLRILNPSFFRNFVFAQHQVMNPAIGVFGIHRVISVLIGLCRSEPEMPLVSVGCGAGLLEAGGKKNVKNPFFLVDPAPSSYYPKLKNFDEVVNTCGLPTTHSSTQQLIEQHPELVDHRALLLLNWTGCEEEDDYDVEAIGLLKPKAIMIVYETTGIAGSPALHKFLETHTGYYEKEINFIMPISGCSHDHIVIKWLVSEKPERPCFKMPYLCELCKKPSNDFRL